MLTLPIKRQWFDMICRGEKREEYRECTEYWGKRLNTARLGCYWNEINEIFEVKIRAGYNSKSPTATLQVRLTTGRGVQEWGANPAKYYYIMQILGVKNIENWSQEASK